MICLFSLANIVQTFKKTNKNRKKVRFLLKKSRYPAVFLLFDGYF